MNRTQQENQKESRRLGPRKLVVPSYSLSLLSVQVARTRFQIPRVAESRGSSQYDHLTASKEKASAPAFLRRASTEGNLVKFHSRFLSEENDSPARGKEDATMI